MNFYETYPECSLPSAVSKKETMKLVSHHARFRDVIFFFEKRGNNKYQPLTLIGNLMPLLTGSVRSYTSFHLMDESVLKATNVKLSSLVWKIRQFNLRDNFSVSVTDCKAIFPTNPIFHCNWSARKDPSYHCATKQGPRTTNLTAADLEHYLQSGSLLAQKNRTTVRKHLKR